jgi:hypothetical protein
MDGTMRFTFSAVSTATGDLTVGNLIDNMRITGLAPLVEFETATGADHEASGGNIPSILVNGEVPAGGAVLTLAVGGGTATNGLDYNLTTTLTIPAGNYFNTPFALPLSIVNDGVFEGDETVLVNLVSIESNDPLALDPIIAATDCGTTPIASNTYTILEFNPLSTEVAMLTLENFCTHAELQFSNPTLGSEQRLQPSLEVSSDLNTWQSFGVWSNTTSLRVQPSQALSYYRVAYPNEEGQIEYSNVVAYESACFNNEDVTFYPNPTSAANSQPASLNFYASQGNNTFWQVMDATGRIVNQGHHIANASGNQTLQLPTLQLSAGMYVVRLQQPEWLPLPWGWNTVYPLSPAQGCARRHGRVALPSSHT